MLQQIFLEIANALNISIPEIKLMSFAIDSLLERQMTFYPHSDSKSVCITSGPIICKPDIESHD